MHLRTSLATLSLLSSFAAAAPATVAKEARSPRNKVQQVEAGKYRKSAVTELAKIRHKYAKYTNASLELSNMVARDYGEAGASDWGESYTVPLTIGTPGQTLNIDLDTGSFDLWVFSDFLPSYDDENHNIYSPDQSSSSAADSGATFSVAYGDHSTASGVVYTDVASIAGISADSQAIKCATAVSEQFEYGPSDGLLGMGFSATTSGIAPNGATAWFGNILGQLDAQVFTASLNYDAPGCYTFGEVDSSQYSGNIAYTPIVGSTGWWEIEIGVNGASYEFTTAIVDTGTTLVLMADDICAAYYAEVPGAMNYGGEWVYPSSSIATLPGFSFSVSGTWVTAYGTYLNFAYSFTDQYGTDWYSGALQSSDGIGVNILGDYFLSSVFAVFDYGNAQVGFAVKA